MQQEFSQNCRAASVDVLGARVHYLYAGSGPPMILIHGLVGSSANWHKNVASLAANATVYAIDQINVGYSDRVAGLDASLEAAADRLAAFMAALGLEAADVVGHSHGGSVSLMLAARHAHRVRRLILFAPANPYSDSSNLLVAFYSTRVGAGTARLAPYLPTWLHNIALGRMYGDPVRIGEGCLPGYISGLRMPGTVSHILAIVRCWFADMAKLKAALPRIAGIPALLIWGDGDRAVSLKSGMMLHRALTNSEFVVVPGAGHVVFEELPDQSNRIMLEWLDSASVTTAVAGSTNHRPRGASLAPGPSTIAAMQQLSPES